MNTDPDAGCTPEEMDQAEWNAVMLEELAWREMEDRLLAQQETEKARGE
jgi:hypothetical protein